MNEKTTPVAVVTPVVSTPDKAGSPALAAMADKNETPKKEEEAATVPPAPKS